MAIIGEKIRSYVRNQINKRQQILSADGIKSDTDLIYLDAKTSWIKLASGVSIGASKLAEIGYKTKDHPTLQGMGLAKRHILFGGLADFINPKSPLQLKQGILAPFNTGTNINPSSYDISSPFGIVPNPGIKDASIKCLNRGSLKKAKIKIRVENKFQLQTIDVLYLRLGYTMLLEWGNSHYHDKNGKLQPMTTSLVEDQFFNSSKMNFISFLDSIEKQRKKTQGNYDGFIGKVSNFNWSFNDDGSYDVDLELISLGDVIESLKSNVTLDSNTLEYLETSTAGSVNAATTSEDSINSNKTLNSIFSILYLWKDFYKTPLDLFLNGTGTYNQSNPIKINYTEKSSPPATTTAYIGDVLDIPTSTNVAFTTGDYTLSVTLGFLDTRPSSGFIAGDPSTYKFRDKSPNQGGDTFTYGDGTYGHINQGGDGQSYMTLKGNFVGTSKEDLIAEIISAPNSASINADFSYSGPSTLDFKAMQFWLSYGGFNTSATKTGARNWTDTKPLNSNVGTDNNTQYLKYYKSFLNDSSRQLKVLTFKNNRWSDTLPKAEHIVTKVGLPAGDNISTYRILLAGVPAHNSSPTSKYNVMYHCWRTGDSTYPVASMVRDQIATFQGTKMWRGNFGHYIFNRYNSGTVRVLGYDYGKYSTDGVSITNVENKVPITRRYDVPLVTTSIYQSNVTTTTAKNPLRKFSSGDVMRLYTKTTLPTYIFYMRFGAVLDILKNEIICKVNLGSPNSDNPNIIRINNNPNPGTTDGDNMKFVSYMQNKPNLTSFDLNKCFVASPLSFEASGSMNGNDFKIDSEGNLKEWVYNKTSANSMNIYLNFFFIGETLSSNTDAEGNVSVYNFVKGLCTGINRAFANVPNLEPVIDETNNILSIVDSSHNRSENDRDYLLNPYGFMSDPEIYKKHPKSGLDLSMFKDQGSFVRKVDLKTAITPAYATMVTVGATAGGYVKGVEATAFANWNRDLTDRFKTELVPASSDNSKLTLSGQIDDAYTAFQKVWLVQNDSMLYPLGSLTPLSSGKDIPGGKLVEIVFDSPTITTNLQIADEYFRAYQSEEKDGSSLGFIPFNVTLKMDGISGIKIYNEIILSTTFLPDNYANNLSFIVTGVDHSLKNEDWETTLKLTLIPSPKSSYNIPMKRSFVKMGNVSSGGSGVVITYNGSVSPAEEDKIVMFMDAMMTAGFTYLEAAGMAGNVMAESGFQEGEMENGKEDRWAPSNDYKNSGVGLMQWTDTGGVPNTRKKYEEKVGATLKSLNPSIPSGYFYPGTTRLNTRPLNQPLWTNGKQMEKKLIALGMDLFKAELEYCKYHVEFNKKNVKINIDRTKSQSSGLKGNSGNLKGKGRLQNVASSGYYLTETIATGLPGAGNKSLTLASATECFLVDGEIPGTVCKVLKSTATSAEINKYKKKLKGRIAKSQRCLDIYKAKKGLP